MQEKAVSLTSLVRKAGAVTMAAGAAIAGVGYYIASNSAKVLTFDSTVNRQQVQQAFQYAVTYIGNTIRSGVSQAVFQLQQVTDKATGAGAYEFTMEQGRSVTLGEYKFTVNSITSNMMQITATTPSHDFGVTLALVGVAVVSLGAVAFAVGVLLRRSKNKATEAASGAETYLSDSG